MHATKHGTPLRVLVAVHGYPPTHHGGAEREAARLAKQLAGVGQQVMVFCVESTEDGSNGVHWEDRREEDVLVRRVSLDLGADPDGFLASFDNRRIERAFRTCLSEFEPDIVHLYSGYLLSGSIIRAAKAYEIPVVVSLMDNWWLCHRITLVRTDGTRCAGPVPLDCAKCQAGMSRRYRLASTVFPRGTDFVWSMADRVPPLADQLGLTEQQQRAKTLPALLRQADALISSSQYLADTHSRYGIDPGRIRVWRQGLDLDECLMRQPSDTLRVGYLGQIKPHKGVHLLVNAWRRLHGDQPRRLVLYGSAAGVEAYAARLRDALATLDTASWAGEFRGSEVWEILANLDVVVVPSRWGENSPNIILEAQAVGVPVIGANLGGIPELVTHGENGLLFTADDADDLARQLQLLLDQPDELARLKSARNRFQTVGDDVERILDLYQSLTIQRSTGTLSVA
jgi:glycosyltransferase involved in cell wall biosynthesis